MAKQLKTEPQKLIDQMTIEADHRAFVELRDMFVKDLTLRFKAIQYKIENWSDAIANEELLTARLKAIAAETDWTDNNKLDMALICAILWNIEEIE
jgi:hypothetical protein